METIKVNTSQHIEIDYPVAGLGERITAALIDLGIFVGLYILFLLFGLLTGISGSNSAYVFYALVIIYVACYVFYDLLCEIFMNGQSVGKRIMKIKVISLDGSQPSLGQYLIRWLFRLVDSIFTAQLGAIISIAVSQNRQRIGDIAAGTTVIKTTPYTPLNQVAFHPVEDEYNPIFSDVTQLTDRDIELIHEVIDTYYKTSNAELIYITSAKVATLLSINIPSGMNEMDFLKTVIKDYNHQTAIVR